MENYSSPNGKLIYAKDFHILSGKEISKELTKMLVSIQGIQTKKTIIFEKGTYHIDSNVSRHCCISQTPPETTNLKHGRPLT